MSAELRDLTIGYRSRRRVSTVATGLRAVARRGELTALLGPNGCGKSTLLRTLCGLQPALGGQIWLDGTDLTRIPAELLARRVAVVLTEHIDPGLLSARELAGLGRIPYLGPSGRLTGHDRTVVDWALAAVGAGHLAARPAGELSDGERQRVLCARALAQQPSVLILDEPTAFLDVASRAGLVEVLGGLARDHNLAIIISTHELELALRVADRVWLLGPDGALRDATPEKLVLDGDIGTLFDGETLRFDPSSGVFAVRATGGRNARLYAPEPLRGALQRALPRQGWQIDEPAEMVVTAADPGAMTLRCGGDRATAATLESLPALLRTRPVGARSCVPATETATVLAELSRISPYFAVGTGPVADGWRPVRQLYTDTELLGGYVDRVRARIGAPDQRVAVSTLFLGLAARLWSIGLGALAGHRLLFDLAPEHLLFRESDGQIRLHVEDPVGWRGDDLEPRLAGAVFDVHLIPLIEAVHRLGPISERLLRGNAASALLGAARMFDSRMLADHGPHGAGWQLAGRLCTDERLADTVRPTSDGYRRTSCCLYYRTPGGGLCGDCALTHKPRQRPTMPQ